MAAALMVVFAVACDDSPSSKGGPSTTEVGEGGAGGADAVSATWGDRARALASGELDGVVWRALGLWGPSPTPGGEDEEALCVESESERSEPALVCPGGLAPLSSPEAGGETLDTPKVVLTDELQFVVGMVNPGVARVVVELGSGTPVEAEIVGDHGIHYVAALSADASASEVVAYAATGAELDRRDFSGSGSDDPYESPSTYHRIILDEPPPCVEPDPDPVLCGTGDPGG